ncbi:MarR family transcriptional regulator [Mesobacillus maritimus]|uniref:MarR family winged helix-turn-helix transcriptional regulator n=1 Tax=Mesobacillus maritimus TaxID=1643336 RepID=UPI00203F36E3|nr:MarR family transcriptional regulator [Mesobacillus maritimus]MCM3668596.1 MarR family transcriptional regulator [Mesobacillus maritimus]
MEETDLCIHFLLGKALQHVKQISKAKLAPYGVTPVQFALLRLLWEKDGEYGFVLANRLLIDSATITGVIDRLEQNGLIQRRIDQKDRRNKRVFLTEKGRSLEAPLIKKMNEMNDEVMSKFDADKVQCFREMLFEIGIKKKVRM